MNEKIIKKLFNYALKSDKTCDFPVSAIVFKDDKIISYGYNKRNKSNITTDHAEITAIKKANKKIKNWNLQGYNMIVTLEPCHMCEQVILESRLDNVFYIIPRLKTKKAYKGTDFENYIYDGPEKVEYENKITSFFKDKR